MRSERPASSTATALLTRGPAQDAKLIAMQQNGLTDCELDPASLEGAGAAAFAALGIERVVVAGLPRTARLTLAPVGLPPLATRVVVDATPEGVAPASFPELHAEGVRAVRFTLPPAPEAMATRLDDMLRIADHLAPLGWHAELRLSPDTRDLAHCEWSLTRLPVALCLTNLVDYVGQRPSGDPDLAFILDLLQMGRTWLKLSGASLACPTAALTRFVNEAVEQRSDRIVWGSGIAPAGCDRTAHVAGALAALEALISDEADRAAVLVENPRRLYGFPG